MGIASRIFPSFHRSSLVVWFSSRWRWWVRNLGFRLRHHLPSLSPKGHRNCFNLFSLPLGLYGAAKHHQVTLFFYMIILFCLFIVQFAIACSCLAVNKHQQRIFAEEGWNTVSDEIKSEVQTTFTCCGFNSTIANDHPSCDTVNKICCPTNSPIDCACSPCLPKLETNIDSAFFVSGSIGLFFSFTEVRSSNFN